VEIKFYKQLYFFTRFFFKQVARAGKRTRDLLILFIFSSHHFTAEPQRLPTNSCNLRKDFTASAPLGRKIMQVCEISGFSGRGDFLEKSVFVRHKKTRFSTGVQGHRNHLPGQKSNYDLGPML
jgi:hypothetical protein